MAVGPKVVSQKNYLQSRSKNVGQKEKPKQRKPFNILDDNKEIKNVNIAKEVFKKDIQANIELFSNKNYCMESQKKTLITLREVILTVELALKG